MKTKHSKITLHRTLSYFILMAILLVTCAGCTTKESYALRLAAAAPYVDDTKAQAYTEQLELDGENSKASMYSASIPHPVDAAAQEEFTEGNPNAAAELGGSTNALKLTAMIAGKELDVMFCDVQTAGRFARSESFYTLESLFTEEELSTIAPERRLAYEKLDDENNPTGELFPACGIDVSGNKALTEFIGSDQIGVFVVANAVDLDMAKNFVLQLVQETA